MASTLTTTGSPASAASAAPKPLFTAPNSGLHDEVTVLGNRLIGKSVLNNFGSSGKNSRLYFFDSKMKYREVIIDANCVDCIDTFEPGLFLAGEKIFFTKTKNKQKGIFSLDGKDKVKGYSFPVSKDTECRILTSFADKLYVGCVSRKLQFQKPSESMFAISTDGSVNAVALPTKGLWELVYQGANQLMLKMVEEANPATHRFYELDKNGAVSKQFDVTGVFGDLVTIVAKVDNGWILEASLSSDDGVYIQGVRNCGDFLSYSQNFLMDSNGTLSQLGSLKEGESIVSDMSWFKNGTLNFERYITNSENLPIRQERYEVNQAGQVKKLSSLNGPNFKSCRNLEWIETGTDHLARRGNAGFAYFADFNKYARVVAAEKLCPSISKGKAKGKIMFNGYAICLQGGKLMAYPYPEWKMPQLPEGDFPVINQLASNEKIETTKFQAKGVGDRTWPVKCPAFIDEPYRIGIPKIPGLYEGPQLKVLGFKFDGETFTRLEDGTYNPATQPGDLVGCYAILGWLIPNPKNANFYHIGTINRTAKGYYWENAGGIRLRLTLSGTILTTDKSNPKEDRGKQFVTFG